MSVEVLPARLFTSRLPNGNQEFVCDLRFTGDDVPPPHLHWRIQHQGQVILTGSASPGPNSNHLSLSALLPSSWAGGTLVIEWDGAQRTFPIEHWSATQTFRLPLAGFVLVLGGHRIGEVHRHAQQIRSQQFGWDFLPMTSEWALLRSAFNEQIQPDGFVGFGQPVLSPAAGRVVSAIDGLPDVEQVGVYPDSQPFLTDLRRAQGNSIIIEHEAGIFSCIAHLRMSSVIVKAGDQVEAGQPIGQLGNSGFSSGPHLHLHFMDGSDPLTAAPLPVQLTVEGQHYAPLTGEILMVD